MKYSIDETVATNNGLSLQEVLLLMVIKEGTDIPTMINHFIDKEYIVKDMFGNYLLTQRWDDVLSKILLESDSVIPKNDDVMPLVEELRELFPKGIKTGSSAWRGNRREINLRLQKFLKIYGNTYSFDQIVAATKKYVESFNGNYTYMRILKYFILKDEKKVDDEGHVYIEQVSELANFLENEMNEQNDREWMTEMR